MWSPPLIPPSGSPLGVIQGGFPKVVPQVCSPKMGPTGGVFLCVYRKRGPTRGFPHRGSPNEAPQGGP